MSRRQAPTAGQGAPTTDELAAACAVLLRAVGHSREPDPSTRPEPLMTPAQAAEWAQVSEDTLERWRTLGLRSYGEGRIRRYRGSDILVFLAGLESDEDDDFGDVTQRAIEAARKIKETASGIHS